MKRSILCLFFVLLATGLALPAFAQDAPKKEEKFVLNLGTIAPPATPWSNQLNSMAKRIEKESGGRIEVRLFLGTAGGETSIVRQARRGELQGAAVSLGALASAVPEMNVFELPYLFDSFTEADRIIDNHLYGPVKTLLATYGFELYLFGENGYRNFAAKGKCVRTPADLATLQMRVQESWVHEEMYRALSGNPVRIAVPETLPALQTGNVNGFDNTPLFAFAASWYQAVDHWTISDHIYQPAAVVYSKKWFDTLPPDLQKVLLDNQKPETDNGRKMVRALNPLLINNLRAAKITVCELTAEEKAVFAKDSKKVHTLFRQRVGKKGAELLDIIEKAKKEK
ncbi:MAG: TRAP transporter substrate-binding protein [Bradymonadaceae bacterium]|nr:TRAP transporter substrate-binding protein [Lujinxingiaceae bacterium]